MKRFGSSPHGVFLRDGEWRSEVSDKKMCPHAESCELFPQFSLKAALKLWQIHYCEATFEGCERYKLSLEGKPVPLTLLPDGTSLGAKPAK